MSESLALTLDVRFGDPCPFVECKIICSVRPSSPLATRRSADKLRRHPKLYAKSGYRLVRSDDRNTIWIARRPSEQYIPLIG